MDSDTLNYFCMLSEIVAKEDWKSALDSLVSILRKQFVFDNLAIYLVHDTESMPEVVYARSVGRGRSKEADVSWGEDLANQVLSTKKIICVVSSPTVERTEMPYLLGLPLTLDRGQGALVFVRFGGPEYTQEQIPIAVLVAAIVVSIYDRHTLRDHEAKLEIARNRAQLQDDFIATISHDLHTPLGFIKGYATSLLRSDTTWDVKTQREFLSIIDEETDHLISLIDRLLDSARLQSGVIYLNLQPVRLDSLIRDIVMRVKGRNKTLEIDLNLKPVPSIQADTIRLSQIFENLFDNAIKYAPNSKISLSLRDQGQKQTIIFADCGPGIPVEHLPFIFERFYRVHEKSTTRGTGLGLFICKQIVQAHGGRISVDTAPGKGTAFRIDLPIRQSGT